MKSPYLLSLALIFLFNYASAQWGTYTSGTTYYATNSSYKVGIGLSSTTAASEKLHVIGNILSTGTISGTTLISTGNIQASLTNNLSLLTGANTRLTILNSNGNVGIGTITPSEKLHLNGSIRGDQSGALRVSSGNGTVDIGAKTSSYGNLDTDRNAFLFNKKVVVTGGVFDSFSGALTLQAAGTTGLTLLTSGNVGIGTTLASNPNNYKLAVNGRIGAKEVQVETNSGAWPDYVFDSSYTLMPLAELGTFINRNRHLPGVPSAAEIETTGHRLGEMDIVLLQKIEELTLYLLELKAENDTLKKRLDALEAGK